MEQFIQVTVMHACILCVCCHGATYIHIVVWESLRRLHGTSCFGSRAPETPPIKTQPYAALGLRFTYFKLLSEVSRDDNTIRSSRHSIGPHQAPSVTDSRPLPVNLVKPLWLPVAEDWMTRSSTCWCVTPLLAWTVKSEKLRLKVHQTSPLVFIVNTRRILVSTQFLD